MKTLNTLCNQHIISNEHPSLPGHFPSNPIVPGVVILNTVFSKLESEHPSRQITGIKKLKFLHPLGSEELFTINFGDIKNNGVRFKCLLSVTNTLMAEGHLKLQPIEINCNNATPI